jgi:hypothetical protein
MSEDWLNANSAVTDQQKTMQREALTLAQLHVAVFARSPAGADLLAQWTDRMRKKRVAVNASVQEYAAVEAVRDFVEGIHRQIELASQLSKTIEGTK